MAYNIGVANFVRMWLQNVRGCDRPKYLVQFSYREKILQTRKYTLNHTILDREKLSLCQPNTIDLGFDSRAPCCKQGAYIKHFLTNFRRCQIRVRDALQRNFWSRPKIVARPTQLWKKHCLWILEGRLITNPILSALHLQHPKSYIYVHFQLVISNWLGFHYESETINKAHN